jgi:cysteinyl-tRNA synthetase
VRLRDSRSGELREVAPGADGVIGMYVCGPTVYDYIHVGNARPFVVYLLMKRYLEWRGQPVRLVENITDVEDKILAAAARAGEPSEALAARFAAAYVEDTDRLGLGRPDVEPYARRSIEDIIALISRLVESGAAYASQGDVYFRVRSFREYGSVSHQRIERLREGARIEPGEAKEDPLDFALWKAAKPGEDAHWPSPWGPGRPGWHIECSAMAERHLGPEFAVHGGGRDLIFPHHENEFAQSRAAGRAFAEVWAHNGMLTLGSEKMSKSVGNIEPLREALERPRGAETLIMLFLRAHYRSPVEYSPTTWQQAEATCETLRDAFRLEAGDHGGDGEALRAEIVAALDDDFRTPDAVAAVFGADLRDRALRAVAAEVLGVLGLGSLLEEEQAPAELVDLARRRDAARARRDYAEADALRERIAQAGWEARDTPAGTELYRA